ncbi:MAG: NusG domain II-containing protein [bacterium]|nr:NusG domain II-containing protein [bacterium]
MNIKKDILFFSIIFLIILFSYLFSKFRIIGGDDIVLIQVDRKDFWLLLSENRIVEVLGPLGKSIIEIKDRRVRMLFSPCPDKLCIKEGYIDKAGQVIICVPNRVVIKIEGRAGLDALTY